MHLLASFCCRKGGLASFNPEGAIQEACDRGKKKKKKKKKKKNHFVKMLSSISQRDITGTQLVTVLTQTERGGGGVIVVSTLLFYFPPI